MVKMVDFSSRLNSDGDSMSLRYLKWADTTIAIITTENWVLFRDSVEVVPEVFRMKDESGWNTNKFREFLMDRLPSKSRRDIEKLLFRVGLTEYDEFKLANTTRAVSARDLFWIAFNEEEKMEECVDEVFKEIFLTHTDMGGESIVSPDGLNVKRYGVSRGSYGLYKHRLYPTSTDIEAEVAVYNLAKLMGVECCEAWLTTENGKLVVFSKFEYNFAQEYLVHARRLFSDGERSGDMYRDLVNKVPEFTDDIRRMMVLDFVTRQTDRHLSNLAFKISGDDVSFYKLYDNGRSLFFEDTADFISKAVVDVELYASEVGEIGTYWDVMRDISKEVKISSLVNLDITDDEIEECYATAGILGVRLAGALTWTSECLKLLKRL